MSGFDVRLVRHGLPGALGEPDQLLRLARFRAAHPEVIIGDGGFGTVQARIPRAGRRDRDHQVHARRTARQAR